MKLKLALLIMLAATAAVQAQRGQAERGKQREVPDEQQQAVTNEDRGRAYIISGDSSPLFTAGNNNNIITEPQQSSIFLGRGWESVRAREPELANLIGHITDQGLITQLDERGLKHFAAPTLSQERFDEVSGDRPISDLQIQRLLTGMLADNSVQRPNANTIYMIFLGPDLRSSLGELSPGKHYLAYRNAFNAAGMKIHYVVVPFEGDQDSAYRIALRAFLSALNRSEPGQ